MFTSATFCLHHPHPHHDQLSVISYQLPVTSYQLPVTVTVTIIVTVTVVVITIIIIPTNNVLGVKKKIIEKVEKKSGKKKLG